MILFHFSAHLPLVKTYTKNTDGTVEKTSYPDVYLVSSHQDTVNSLPQLLAAIKHHAAQGHCLVKGTLSRQVVNESRAGTTDTTGLTQWVCLDIDGLPTKDSIDSILSQLGINDTSYILQWSGSQGITSNDVRCHIFMMLDKPVPAPFLKQWLIQLNLSVPLLSNAMRLNSSGNAIRWALDITTCQNDKLIFTAPPNLVKIRDPFANKERYQLVEKKKHTFTLPAQINSIAVNKALTETRKQELRAAAGLTVKKSVFKHLKDTEVLSKPDAAIVTVDRVGAQFTYVNLNAGDSAAYFHPNNNPDIIYNFKGEPNYLTKELDPDYWKQATIALRKEQHSEQQEQQQEQEAAQVGAHVATTGEVRLALRDRKTGVYYHGTFNEKTELLDLVVAKNEKQVRDFCMQFNVPIGDYVPIWDIVFDPHLDERINVATRTINLFQRTQYMRAKHKKVNQCPPTIFKVIQNALGGEPDTIEHFMNWLAFIVQFRTRTETAWVLYGTEGCLTGDTIIDYRRGNRPGSRAITLKDAYEKFSGTYKGSARSWNPAITTFVKSVKDNATIGLHEVHSITEAGIKPVFELRTLGGRRIKSTGDHPFMRTDGTFTPLNQLKPGDQIVIEGEKNPTGRFERKKRHTTYSIPHHPTAWVHTIAGKNYKRSHTSRLVVEAAMNNMELSTFINVLRVHPEIASTLKYLEADVVVHHLDEDPMNADLSNLECVNKENHDRHHAQETGLGMISTTYDTVQTFVACGEEMTYDITMKAPYHNFIANGFAVANTGKGMLMKHILRPMLGMNQTVAMRAEQLQQQFNVFMKNTLLVFYDEAHISNMKDAEMVLEKLRNFITEDPISLRVMHANPVEIPNYSNHILASNQPNVITLRPNDRRWNIGRFQHEKLVTTDREFSIIQNGTELQAFYDYLLGFAVDKEQARTPLMTADRQQLIDTTLSSADEVALALSARGANMEFFLDQLPTDNTYMANAMAMNKVEDYKAILLTLLERTDADGMCRIARDEIHGLFAYAVGSMPDTPNKFTKFLAHRNIHTRKMRMPRPVFGIEVKWKDAVHFKRYLAEYFPTPGQVAHAPAAPTKPRGRTK